MNEKLGKFVTDKPVITVLIIMAITILMGMINAMPDTFGLDKKDKEDESSFLPDNKVANADEEIDENYGIQIRRLTILVEGKNGNVLTKESLIDILTVEKKMSEDEKVLYILFPQPGNMSSIASVLAREIAGEEASYDQMLDALNATSEEDLQDMILGASQDPEKGPQLAMFLTKDFRKNADQSIVKAKGSLIFVLLNSEKYDEIVEDKNNPILDADEAIVDIFDTTDFKGVDRMGIVEDEYISQQIDEETGGVMEFLLMMVFVLIIVILLFTYRSIFDTVISLLALVFAITWMNGMGVLLGLHFTSMYQAVPIMLMGLGIDYAIHLVMRYREERIHYGKTIRDALSITTVSVGAALFLATVTTGISFGSNTISEIQPMKEFAIFALVGIVSAFITMVTFVPASKMIWHGSIWPWVRKVYHGKMENKLPPVVRKILAGLFGEKQPMNGQLNAGNGKAMGEESGNSVQTGSKANSKNNHTGADTALSRVLAKGAVAAEHHAIPVIVLVVFISLICTALATQLDTEFDFTEFLPADAQISEDIIYITEEFDFGTEESNILIRGKIDDPDVLIAIDDTQKEIENDRHTNEQDPYESILTVMYDVATGDGDLDFNATFSEKYNNSQTDEDGVPDQNITELFDFLMEHDDYKGQVIRFLHFNNETGEYDGAVIRVAVNSQNGAKSEEIYRDMNDDLKPLENEEKIDSTIATSGPVLVHVIVKSIETSGINSLIITVIVAGVILTFVFWVTDKSKVLGIITEVPVILVIAWTFAAIYLIGMSLNVMTIMIASLTVGLGITYGIHVTHRFVEDLAEFDDIDKACRSTVTNTGMALFGAAITTIGGFGILVFAPIPPMRKFGAISALSIGFSLIASVFILPTFLSLWAKHVKKHDPCYFQHHADVKNKIEEDTLSCDETAGKQIKDPDEAAGSTIPEKMDPTIPEKEPGHEIDESPDESKGEEHEDVPSKDGDDDPAGEGNIDRPIIEGNDIGPAGDEQDVTVEQDLIDMKKDMILDEDYESLQDVGSSEKDIPVDLKEAVELSDPAEMDDEVDLNDPAELDDKVDLNDPTELDDEVELDGPAKQDNHVDLNDPEELDGKVEMGGPAEFDDEVELDEPDDLEVPDVSEDNEKEK